MGKREHIKTRRRRRRLRGEGGEARGGEGEGKRRSVFALILGSISTMKELVF